MTTDHLSHRRDWYRFFPDGSIEFIVVTRVLSLILLCALPIVHDNQRPAVLLALASMLWVDYLLVLWWFVQVATDLDVLLGDGARSADQVWLRRLSAAALGALPSLAALAAATILFLPQLDFLPIPPALRGSARHRMLIACGVLFVAFLFSGTAGLRRVLACSPLWLALYLIPGIHWLAVHRLLGSLNDRLDHGQIAYAAGDDSHGTGQAIWVADVAWFLAMVPWLLTAILVLSRGAWEGGGLVAASSICGIAMAMLFAVADVAVMERLQRRFVTAIRKTEQ